MLSDGRGANFCQPLLQRRRTRSQDRWQSWAEISTKTAASLGVEPATCSKVETGSGKLEGRWPRGGTARTP
jgi:hypothetical protein